MIKRNKRNISAKALNTGPSKCIFVQGHGKSNSKESQPPYLQKEKKYINDNTLIYKTRHYLILCIQLCSFEIHNQHGRDSLWLTLFYARNLHSLFQSTLHWDCSFSLGGTSQNQSIVRVLFLGLQLYTSEDTLLSDNLDWVILRGYMHLILIQKQH